MSRESVLAKYSMPLERHWVKKGTWMNISTREGIGVYLAPLEEIDGGSTLFGTLKDVFKHHLIRDYKIKDNGEVYFLAPHGFKFGRLLGEIARLYEILYEKEAYNRGYKAVEK